jgi:hypothetical protein
LTINEFWQLSWREFLLYRMAYENREIKEWERTRTLAYMMYRANTTDKAPKSIKAFFPLPSDEVEDESPKLTDDQFKRTLKLYGVN